MDGRKIRKGDKKGTCNSFTPKKPFMPLFWGA
jgi:hypothetical protein